jgi:hypothetical protein
MRVIDKKEDYPNMLPKEIINSGVALSGDALYEFMVLIEDKKQNDNREDVESALDDAIYELERIRSRL